MFKKFLLATALTTVVAGGAIAHDHGDKKDKMDKSEMNIVEVVTSKDKFSTLAAALTAADLVSTVQSAEGITVFAPTNDAFAKLPEGTLDTLLMEENKAQLQSILKYHVVGSEIMSGDIAMGTSSVATLEGSEVDVTKEDGKVMVDGATVTYADIKAENGVIHVIDSVIMPE
jgi:uncharacterized surface protein with fasciclin (FAS1) repeats